MPDWTPPPNPPALYAQGAWVALNLGWNYNTVNPSGIDPHSNVSWPIRGRLAFPAGRFRGHLLADLDLNGAFTSGYNLMHVETGAGFDLSDGTHLTFGLGGDATRTGVALGPMGAFYRKRRKAPGFRRGDIRRAA